MTREDSIQIVEKLAAHFAVSVPGVRYHARARNGRYKFREKTIVISGAPWRGGEASLIHEFAHHLIVERMGEDGLGHGKHFENALIETAQAHYGEAWKTAYPWHTEYRSLRGAAKDREID